MTRFFNSPFLLGFENLEKLLERTAKYAGEGYPPYNIETVEDGGIAITLAVAGFSKTEMGRHGRGESAGDPWPQAGTRRQNVPSSRHCSATIFTRFRAGGRHRSQFCHVG